MGRPFKKCQNSSPAVLLPSKFSSSVVICVVLFSSIAIKSICGVQLSADHTKDANLTPPSGQRSTDSGTNFDGSVGGNNRGDGDGGSGGSGGSVYHSSIGPSGGTKLAKKRSRHAAATEQDRDRLIGPIRGRP